MEPSLQKRQDHVLKYHHFKCSCMACTNNWNGLSGLSLPRFDPYFSVPHRYSNNFKGAVQQFKYGCAYIKQHYDNFPSSQEIFLMQFRNYAILSGFNEMNAWPFDFQFPSD
jgi:hypothetical protein